MLAEDPEKFGHVYLGQYRPAVVGAIYYREVSALRASGRLCNVPYDPMLKVHVVCDLGFNDYMSLWLVQRLASEIRVVGYIEDRQRTIPEYSADLRQLKYNWGSVWLPHDGFAKTQASANNPHGATAQEQFERLNWQVERVPDIDLDQGIRKTREIFPRVYIDKANAVEGLNRLGRYRRRVDKDGQAHGPVHDDASHGSDGFRYLALVADQFTNGNDAPLISDPYSSFRSRAYG
jgi:phage terminase large subunit